MATALMGHHKALGHLKEARNSVIKPSRHAAAHIETSPLLSGAEDTCMSGSEAPALVGGTHHHHSPKPTASASQMLMALLVLHKGS